MGDVRTPLGVSVLALLAERSMHPYEMCRLLRERHEDRVVKVRPGSLYHTVERLVADALVEPAGTERAGGRPERTTYRITSAGHAALQDRIRTLLAVPLNEYPRFPVALGEAHNLPRAEVVALLATRIAALSREIAEMDAQVPVPDTPEAFLLDWHYLRAMLAAERDWLAALRHRIETKDLEWPLDDSL